MRVLRTGAAAALAATLAATLAASVATAADVAPKDVVFIDGMAPTPLTDTPGDPERGIEWYTDRGRGNCMTCHQNGDLPDISFQGDIAPALDGVADRWTEPELRAILVNAKKVFGPQTFMPALYKDEGFVRVRDDVAGEPIMTAQMIEDVLAYLLTLKE
jgi:sulfur-oxidizing protein SoxX